MVAVLAIAAAAAGPAWGQTTYNVTFGGFAEPAMNTTVSVASLPQTFTEINNTYVFYAWKVISMTAENYTSASVTSGGDGKVSATIANSLLSITISGPFEGTATIHVEGSYWDLNHDSPVPLSCDVTVACPEPPTPHTVRFAEGMSGWQVQDVTASASATAPAVLQNVMAGDSLVVTAPGTLPGKVKSVKAVKYVAPVPVQSIVLNKQTAYLAKDNTMTLSATVLPENAADKSYSWSSDDIAVADVDQNGVVTGHNAGTANIIATANDGSGVKDTCVVTVLSPVILDGVTVLYASNEDTWSTVIGYNPGLMYQEHGDVRLTSNGAFLYFDVSRVYVTGFINPLSLNEYQWLRKVVIHGSEFYYHQGETWQQAIDASRQYNEPWSINNGKVIFSGEWMLVDANWEPVDPTATIDPSTVNYNLELIMEN